MRWLHGRRVEDPINAFVARTVADAHPDADQIRETERDAYAAYQRAERSRTHLDEAMYAELRPLRSGRAHPRPRRPTRRRRGPTGRRPTRPAHRHGTGRRPPARAGGASASPGWSRRGARTLGRRPRGSAGGRLSRGQTAPAAPATDTADRASPTEPRQSRPRAGHRPLTSPPTNGYQRCPIQPASCCLSRHGELTAAQLHGPPVIAPGGAAHLGD